MGTHIILPIIKEVT